VNGARSEPRVYMQPYPAVFDALVAVLGAERWHLVSAERSAGRISAYTRATWRSWGEDLTAYVGAVNATSTTVVIDSTLRGAGLVGWGVHQRNFAKAFGALDRYLGYYYRT
jgi:hypothetical protein